MKHLDYNLHSHTSRCGHASGLDEEYVLKAIQCGFKVMGFSDHVMLPGHPQERIRGHHSELKSYIESVRHLQKKYKDQIDIYLGFECEYYPQYEEYYRSLLKDEGFDYLILGQHCFINENNMFEWYLRENCPKERLLKYVDDVIRGMASGLFKYVCHPDYFIRALYQYDDVAEECSIRLIKAAKKYDVPLEINLNGIRGWMMEEDTLHYPYPRFWQLVGKYGVRVTVGVDAHSPDDYLIANYEYANRLIENYHLNVIEDVKEILK